VKYRVYVSAAAWNELKDLPGNVRHRIRDLIDALEAEPRPSNSKQLCLGSRDTELTRLRLDRWRVVYGVDEAERAIDILAVRKRPPYDHGDLETLLSELE
jgi:mRNA interferase RelE/StbE